MSSVRPLLRAASGSYRRTAALSSRRTLFSAGIPTALRSSSGSFSLSSTPLVSRWSPRSSLGAAFSTSADDKEDNKGESPPKEEEEEAAATDSSEEEEEIETPPQIDIEPKEKKGLEQLDFQAETKQLLDIVTHSLYTDKEVFLRELISNASDACEKVRYMQSTSEKLIETDTPLEIRLQTDEINGRLIISDTGIGMTKDEMVTNLGTIARSGSKAFLHELKQRSQQETDHESAQRGIIGKFGVGFYSSFMIGDKVQVRSRSALESHAEESPKVWSSEGIGSYEIYDLDDGVRQQRGSSIVIQLKDDCIEYCDEKRLEKILKKYSNFVNHPIFLNGNRVNTVGAIWAKEQKDVKNEEYTEFYKYIANAYDDPLDRLHFRADAPIDVKALLFIPSFHMEKQGMPRMEPGVSLYSRKVLIESQSRDILPDWMRFVKGVVDSEDLPLSISREKPQDSALIEKLKKVLVRKFISNLKTMIKKDISKYKEEFYMEYGFFLKEGVCQDSEFQEGLSKLLYFETNKGTKGELFSFDEYVSKLKPEEKEIYYLTAPSRTLALQSPYMEAMNKAGREVFLLYNTIDDFVFANLGKYGDRKIVSIESAKLEDLKDEDKKADSSDSDDDKEKKKDEVRELSQKEGDEFCAWLKVILPDKINECKTTTRLTTTPAMIVDNESGAMRRMMRFVETQEGGTGYTDASAIAAQKVHINPRHSIIVHLNDIREKEPTLAKVIAEQIYDNCLVAAGLLEDGRSMLPRLNNILLTVLKDANPTESPIEEPKVEPEIVGATSREPQDAKDGDEEEAEFSSKRPNPRLQKVSVSDNEFKKRMAHLGVTKEEYDTVKEQAKRYLGDPDDPDDEGEPIDELLKSQKKSSKQSSKKKKHKH